ncbi:major facilitator superfamily domain-containing protein [Penicillium lividum]|nr:major facilitator superfamily domain-containing protein [Penicillium lividum]
MEEGIEGYSVFRPWQKNCIIGLAAFAGWFSTISSFIYFPAIPYIASDLNVGVEKVNLTVTSYLIMSGIFPSIMGDAADRFGRRPVFLLGLTIYFAANIGLALQSSFGLLFFLRMLQSAGISGTYSIAYGVLSDMFTPAERGGYSGIISFFLNTPPSIGPVISGLLLIRWDWRSIFWFLSAATPFCLIPIVLLLPETARSIVGDGSIPTRGINRPLITVLVPKVTSNSHPDPSRKERRRFPNPLMSLKLIRHPNTAIILVSYGINYTVYSCLQATLSSLFVEIYHVSGVVSGLIYLPFGIACAVAAFATGKLLDRNYRITATERGIPVDRRKAESLSDFPIERARLRTLKLFVAISAALIMGYGWLLWAHTSMAGPLVLQFFIGLSIQSLFTALNTLLVDIHPDCPSTAQAACNFVRCETAAAFLAALNALLGRIGSGWCFVLFGGIEMLIVPMLFLLEWKGMEWRQSQASKQRA